MLYYCKEKGKKWKFESFNVRAKEISEIPQGLFKHAPLLKEQQ